HNPDGATVLKHTLQDVGPPAPIHVLLGVLGDKDYLGMIRELAVVADGFVFTVPPTAPKQRRWNLRRLEEEPALVLALAGLGGARRYGFQEYDGPPLEPLELYTEKSGEEIVQQLYAFEDKGGRKVALRPEMTPTLARMVGARAQALKKPIRWFSIPQLFRYERQQRGRLREHFQLNMDIIGEAGPLADAELIAATIDIMRAFGFGPTDVRLRLSDRRVLTSLLRKHPQFQGERVQIAFEVLDKIERQGRSETERRLREAQFDASAIERLFEIASLKGLEAVQEELRSCPDGPAAGE